MESENFLNDVNKDHVKNLRKIEGSRKKELIDWAKDLEKHIPKEKHYTICAKIINELKKPENEDLKCSDVYVREILPEKYKDKTKITNANIEIQKIKEEMKNAPKIPVTINGKQEYVTDPKVLDIKNKEDIKPITALQQAKIAKHREQIARDLEAKGFDTTEKNDNKIFTKEGTPGEINTFVIDWNNKNRSNDKWLLILQKATTKVK